MNISCEDLKQLWDWDCSAQNDPPGKYTYGGAVMSPKTEMLWDNFVGADRQFTSEMMRLTKQQLRWYGRMKMVLSIHPGNGLHIVAISDRSGVIDIMKGEGDTDHLETAFKNLGHKRSRLYLDKIEVSAAMKNQYDLILLDTSNHLDRVIDDFTVATSSTVLNGLIQAVIPRDLIELANFGQFLEMIGLKIVYRSEPFPRAQREDCMVLLVKDNECTRFWLAKALTNVLVHNIEFAKRTRHTSIKMMGSACPSVFFDTIVKLHRAAYKQCASLHPDDPLSFSQEAEMIQFHQQDPESTPTSLPPQVETYSEDSPVILTALIAHPTEGIKDCAQPIPSEGESTLIIGEKCREPEELKPSGTIGQSS